MEQYSLLVVLFCKANPHMRGGSDLSGVEWRPGHFLYGNPTKDVKQFLFTPRHLGDWGHLNGTRTFPAGTAKILSVMGHNL